MNLIDYASSIFCFCSTGYTIYLYRKASKTLKRSEENLQKATRKEWIARWINLQTNLRWVEMMEKSKSNRTQQS